MSYPRETVEFLPVTVMVDNVAVTTGVEFCITESRVRPVTWIAPLVVGAERGVMIDSLNPGNYVVWAKVTDAPETVVLVCGTFTID